MQSCGCASLLIARLPRDLVAIVAGYMHEEPDAWQFEAAIGLGAMRDGRTSGHSVTDEAEFMRTASSGLMVTMIRTELAGRGRIGIKCVHYTGNGPVADSLTGWRVINVYEAANHGVCFMDEVFGDLTPGDLMGVMLTSESRGHIENAIGAMYRRVSKATERARAKK